MRRVIFAVLAVLYVLAALYHLAGLFFPVNDAPAWRHAVFVAINGFCAYGLLTRPAFFIYVFPLLIVQQVYSHGSALLLTWRQQHQIDWISVGVLFILPLTMALLLADRNQKNRREPNR